MNFRISSLFTTHCLRPIEAPDFQRQLSCKAFVIEKACQNIGLLCTQECSLLARYEAKAPHQLVQRTRTLVLFIITPSVLGGHPQ